MEAKFPAELAYADALAPDGFETPTWVAKRKAG